MEKQISPLAFDSLVFEVRERFGSLTDPRKRVTEDTYPLVDTMMSGLAMFFFQDPSLLQFQKALEETHKISNLTTFFNVCKVPKSTQMRTLIDGVLPEEIDPAFNDLHRLIARAKLLQKYRFLDGRYLLLLDGSEYFSSYKCECPHCLKATYKDGSVRFHHQILQAVLARPGMSNVMPFGAEEIRCQDGTDKQDCEINAAKRILSRLHANHPKMDIVIVADGLYSHVPFVKLLREIGWSFILVAKPSDHAALMEDINGLRLSGGVGRLEKTDQKGYRHCYEYANGVVLRADGAETVNWFSYQMINPSGKVTFQNSWVTDLKVTAKNVEELTEAGRSRWKIENEGFNTLKNQGYHIEHNFGHGKKHLSFNMFLLNLLAFMIHEIITLTDKLFQRFKEKCGARYVVWENIRVIFNRFLIRGWKPLLDFLLDPKPRYAHEWT